LIRTCADFRIPAERVAGLTGGWANQNTPGKNAGIGVHISRGGTSHGFSLNINNDLSFFYLIVPCRITHKPVTSMQKELTMALSLEEVAHSVARNLGVVFHSQILRVESLDSLLGQPTGVPLKEPRELLELQQRDETFWA